MIHSDTIFGETLYSARVIYLMDIRLPIPSFLSFLRNVYIRYVSPKASHFFLQCFLSLLYSSLMFTCIYHDVSPIDTYVSHFPKPLRTCIQLGSSCLEYVTSHVAFMSGIDEKYGTLLFISGAIEIAIRIRLKYPIKNAITKQIKQINEK